MFRIINHKKMHILHTLYIHKSEYMGAASSNKDVGEQRRIKNLGIGRYKVSKTGTVALSFVKSLNMALYLQWGNKPLFFLNSFIRKTMNCNCL